MHVKKGGIGNGGLGENRHITDISIYKGVVFNSIVSGKSRGISISVLNKSGLEGNTGLGQSSEEVSIAEKEKRRARKKVTDALRHEKESLEEREFKKARDKMTEALRHEKESLEERELRKERERQNHRAWYKRNRLRLLEEKRLNILQEEERKGGKVASDGPNPNSDLLSCNQGESYDQYQNQGESYDQNQGKYGSQRFSYPPVTYASLRKKRAEDRREASEALAPPKSSFPPLSQNE